MFNTVFDQCLTQITFKENITQYLAFKTIINCFKFVKIYSLILLF